MNYITVRFAMLLALPLVFSFSTSAAPVYPVYDEEVRIEPLPSGTTMRMMADWQNKDIMAKSMPERSYLNIWVRMFPLLSNPLGDPYPETQLRTKLSISNADTFKIFGLDDGKLLATGTALEFDFATGRVQVDGKAYAMEYLWLVPQGASTSLVQWDRGQKLKNGKSAEVRVRLRGGFVIQPTMHETKQDPVPIELWSMINVLTVNDYLKSVVPSEVISSWAVETLRAQAIAARTYGMYEVAIARANNKSYDVDPTTWYQSYQGVQFYLRDTAQWKTVELSRTSDAVTATGSRVITHGGEIIKAFFSSNSGGRTCSFSECFETPTDIPYLKEVADARAVVNSPGGTWGRNANITSATITERLKAIGITPKSPVSKFSHLERGVSKRTWRLRVQLRDGSHIDLDRSQSRKMMPTFGPIRSFKYELGKVGSNGKQAITGHGYGHGVGMSQWGAQLFAAQGWNANRILTHFYTGVKIEEL